MTEVQVFSDLELFTHEPNLTTNIMGREYPAPKPSIDTPWKKIEKSEKTTHRLYYYLSHDRGT